MLADAGERADGATGSRRHDGPGVLPWLPGDDLTSPVPPRPVAPPAAEPPLEPVPQHTAGWLARLTSRLPLRVDPGWRGAVVIGLAVLVAAVVTGGWVLSTRPHAIGVTDSTADPAVAASARSAAASAGSLSPNVTPNSATAAPTSAAVMLVIDVAGKVRHPGLYRLSIGSRINDAVHAAGGPLPGVDLTTLNLAAKLTDGQQIAVGMPGAAPAPGGPGAGQGTAAVTAPVDLNSATLDQLETLPGVGPVLAQHIIDWRVAHGRFATIDQLRDVSGIGDVKFAALRSRVTV
jgi:competence protein ComEA